MTAITITHLRVNDMEYPLGIDDTRPRLTWNVEGPLPPGVQVRVTAATSAGGLDSPDLWDSGWQAFDAPYMRYAGQEPASAQRVHWRIALRQQGALLATADGWFEMGLLCPEDWHGDWIAAAPDEESPRLTRTFSLDALPQNARAYLSGLGFFELYLNGKRVGDEVLQPVWTTYSRQPMTNMLYPYDYQGEYRVPYRTFDIGSLLQAGENRLEVWLGNGWYHQNVRNVEGDLWYGDFPCLLCEVRLDDQLLYSDESFRWQSSPLIENSLFKGEVYDARRQPSPPCPVQVAQAPAGRLFAQCCPSDKAVAKYAVRAAKPDIDNSGSIILDFGQNLSGWVELALRAEAGDRIEMRFAEEVAATEEGWRMDYQSAGGEKQIQQDVYIASGEGDEQYTPRFTWHGYRYARVTLLRREQSLPLGFENGKLHAASFEAEATSAFVTVGHAVTGSLRTDSEAVNWFHDAFVASMQSNQHCGVPLDCPHRERLGYTGDGQISIEPILLTADAMPFYRKWLDDILCAQHRQTGHIPHTAPFYNGGGGPGGWGGAVVFVPWAMYRHSADARILESTYPAMERFMSYLHEHSDDHIVIREEEGGWCLGDWCTPDRVEIPPELVNTYYYIQMADRMADIAAVLRRPQDHTRWRGLADAIREAFHKAFYQPDAQCYSIGRQGSDAFALHAGVVPEPLRGAVYRHMTKRLESGDWRFDTGIFGTPITIDVLTRFGDIDKAYQMITNPHSPSFLDWKRAGATTLYEHWKGSSHNHVMFGAVDSWLYAYAGGLEQAAASVGWQEIVFRPGWIDALSHGSAAVLTPRGRADISWEKSADSLRVSLHVPQTATGRLLLPPAWGGGERLLHGGHYQETFPLEA